MADPRFHISSGPFDLAELAKIAEAEIAGAGADKRRFRDVAALDAAGPDDVSFLDNRRYIAAFAASRAGACVVHPSLAARAPAGMRLLLSDKPYRAYARIARAFYPEARAAAGIHPRAWVDPTAKIGQGTSIAAGAAVEARAEIGARCRIGANATVGEGVTIGEDCRIGAGASLSHCLIGARVVVYPGARIGQEGFGFAMDDGGRLNVPQLGRVIVGNDVEIGANSCVDRGSAGDTTIGDGTMIDNLVQIAHNVRIGRGCVIVAQVGISGSTRLGDYVTIGGQGGLTGHLTIGKGARIAAQSGVHRDVPDGETVGGSPAVPIGEFRRMAGALRLLAKRKGD